MRPEIRVGRALHFKWTNPPLAEFHSFRKFCVCQTERLLTGLIDI